MKHIPLVQSLLFVLLVVVSLSSCDPEPFAPTLTLDLEPYVVYYENEKFVLYDDNFNKKDLPEEIVKLGQVQQFIDMNDQGHKIYSIDDKGDFVTTAKLNTYYNYPKYKSTSYGDEDPSVKVTYDEQIGVLNSEGIDLSKAGEFEFLYKATVGSKSTTRKVILRVYNTYKAMDGKYYSKAVKTSPVGSSNNWGNGFEFGERKPSDIKADGKVNLKLVLNKLLNNKKLKGSSIRGEEEAIPTNCYVGSKKDGKKYIEISIKGSAVERTKDDSYFDAYLYGKGKGNFHVSQTSIAYKMAQDYFQSGAASGMTPSQIFDEIYEQDTISLKTLVVITDLGNGTIKNLELNGTGESKLDVPFITVRYSIKRYIYVPGWAGVNAHEDKNGRKWKPLDETNEFKNWSATFKESFVKTAYFSGSNISIINEAFDNN